ncbi:hypothetical protein NC653_025840 [Populus alba x Populus x berolinensis]|uniref:MADS-box domain-containing protein n=1 Tax=Populus alba x Populus x berolinensis TaxID=444605 RepID=A0AAD6MEJ1_9ROSI|nr:hypothetical protein NC653_025840 [Populus alba x Populus x berolinensis]
MTPVTGNKGQEKSYKKRQTTIEKKATELAILCDVPVCVVIKNNTDGRVSTVPQDRGQVVDILFSYKRKLQAELVAGNAKSKEVKHDETWDPSFNNLPEENLKDFMKELEERSKMVDEAIKRKQEVISKKGKGKRIHAGDGSPEVGNKKAKGDIVLDSRTTNSSFSTDSGLDSFGSSTTSNTGFSDGVSIPRRLTDGTLAGEIGHGTDVEALPASTVRPPKQIHEIKDFLLTARRKDARSVKIKRSRDVVKFKVRCSKYLYTLCVFDPEKADKLKQSLPPGTGDLLFSIPVHMLCYWTISSLCFVQWLFMSVTCHVAHAFCTYLVDLFMPFAPRFECSGPLKKQSE